MGKVVVRVGVSNLFDPSKTITFDGVVDTGAFGLVLPAAWKERLGPFQNITPVELETADQRIVTAEVCGGATIQVDGFRKITGEVVFVEMEPTPNGYEPLVGYTVLELAGVVVDMVTHRLIARKYFDAKAAVL